MELTILSISFWRNVSTVSLQILCFCEIYLTNKFFIYKDFEHNISPDRIPEALARFPSDIQDFWVAKIQELRDYANTLERRAQNTEVIPEQMAQVGQRRAAPAAAGQRPARRRRRNPPAAAAGAPRRRGPSRADWYARRHYPWRRYYKRYYMRGLQSRARYGETYANASAAQRANRATDGMMGQGLYTGHGGFWSTMKTGLLDTAQAAATDISPLLGAGVGVLRKASGIGSYSTASSNHIVNAGKGSGMNDNLPVRVQAPTETGAMVVSHTEFVSNVYAPSSSEFSKQVYDVNPGLENTFKWLSSIAGQYKEYELVQCIFSFKSTVSDMQTANGVIGKVMMASEYNVGDKTARYDTAQELMADIGSVSAKLTNGLVFGIECDPSKLKDGGQKKCIKYVRTRGLRQHQDIQDFDWARLTVATSDVPQILFDQCIGELHVTYTVKLCRPTIKGLMGGNISQSVYCRDDTKDVQTNFTGNGGLSLDTSASSLCESTSNMIDIKLGDPVVLESSDYHILETFGDMESPAFAANRQLSVVPIIWPAQLEGTYKVTLCLRLELADGTGANPGIDGVRLWKQGNVNIIQDMPTGVSAGYDPAPNAPPNIHSGLMTDRFFSNQLIIVEAHVRVQESTGGVDNLIGIQFSSAVGEVGMAFIASQYLSIQEYNSEFNEEDTGRPEWVNVQTKQKILTTGLDSIP